MATVTIEMVILEDVSMINNEKSKINHEKIKLITNDVYNKFYRLIKDMDSSDESWKKILEIGREIVKQHNGDRLCKDLVLAYEDEFERSHKI